MKFTTETLAKFAAAEAEIRALPEATVDVVEPLPHLVDEVAKQAKSQEEYEAECVDPGYVTIRHCEGLEFMCRHHGEELMQHLMHQQRSHPDVMDECPNGCGKKQIVCWQPIIIGGVVL